MYELEKWLDKEGKNLPKGKYVADIGFEVRNDAGGGGGVLNFKMIEILNIAAHFAENVGQVYIDIFSCKEFDTDKAIEITLETFKPKSYEVNIVERGKDFQRD